MQLSNFGNSYTANTYPAVSTQVVGNRSAVADKTAESLVNLLEAASLGTWELDLDTGMVSGCDLFRKFFGLTLPLPVTVLQLLKTINANQRKAIRDAVLSTLLGRRFAIEIAINKGAVWLKLTGNIMKDNGFKKVVGIVEDVTERNAKDRYKSDMIAYLNHEIRSPLTSLKLYVQRASLIARENDNKLIYNFLQKADEQITSMNNLANTYLDHSALEHGLGNLCYDDFDMVSLLKSLTLDLKFRNPEYVFQLKLPSALPLSGDRGKLGQAIANLVNNAIKYSAAGSTITIQCLRQGDQVMVAVKDEGIGIDHKELQKLFDRFYRVSSKATVGVPGYGIGLHLVKGIIEAHQGQLAITSRLNHGSEFYFLLPLKRPA